MKMKKIIAVLAMMSMMAVAATGCANTKDEETSDTQTEETTGDEDAVSEWDSSSDISIISREDGSGTRGAFIELFGIEVKEGDEKVDKTTDARTIRGWYPWRRFRRDATAIRSHCHTRHCPWPSWFHRPIRPRCRSSVPRRPRPKG